MKLTYNTKTYLIALSSLIICINTGCNKDWLDEKPNKNIIIPSTLEDLEGLLDDVSVMNLFSPGLGEIASDGFYMTESGWSSASNHERNAYSWSHDQVTENVSEWNNAYKKIYSCNYVLENIQKIKPSSPAEIINWKNIKGCALFFRAKAFYELAQVFAPPFSISTATSEPGIPLRLASDVSIPTSRQTVQLVYSQIIDDLENAKSNLSITARYKTRPSKAAAFALLSRVLLSMEDYSRALTNADTSLSISNSLLDYNQFDSNSIRPFGFIDKEEVLFHSAMTSYARLNPNSTSGFVMPDLYAIYSDDDLRKSLFFRVNANGTIVFKGTYHTTNLHFTGLSNNEVYLIRAECNARSGNLTEAMDDLNTLLEKRWRAGTFVPQVAIDKEDALDIILTERKKELIFRGLRWSDLRRLNRHPKFAIGTLSRTIGGQSYTLEPNSYKYTHPIPDDIIRLTGILQNTGYF